MYKTIIIIRIHKIIITQVIQKIFDVKSCLEMSDFV